MASSASRSTELVLHASTGPAQALARGESTPVAARAGEQYRVQGQRSDGTVRLEDDVLAIRRGDDLALRYEDGTEVVLTGFFVECARAQCGVEVAAGEAESKWIDGDSVAGATNEKGEALLYAHGNQETVAGLMQAEGFVAGASAGIGDLPGMELAQGQATYLPAGHGAAGGAAALGTPAAIGLGALALGGLALAAGGGSGGGSKPGDGGLNGGGTDPGLDGNNEPDPITIEGSVVAGPVVTDHGLVVAIYGAGGEVLNSGVVDANGQYSLTIAGDYSGPVLVRVHDTTDGPDYRDEASNADRDLGIDLRAFSVVAGQPVVHVNVNMLTELAVRSLSLTGGNDGASVVSLAGLTAQAIIAANEGVAQAFGLSGDLVSTAPPVAVITAAGAPDAAANDYGRILAALSGAEENGDTDGVLAMLLAGLDHNTLSPAAIAAVITGAAAAAAAEGTPALGLVSSVATLMNAGSGNGKGGSGSLSVDSITDDNIISREEAGQGITVAGRGTPGSTVTVTWGDESLEAEVDADGNWSVNLEGEQMPEDGASMLRIEQGEQVLVRAVFIDTTAPASGEAISGFLDGDDVAYELGDEVVDTQVTRPALLISVPAGSHDTPALYIDGDRVEAIHDPVKGTLTPVTALEEGQYIFTWTLTDAIGNEGEPSEGRTLNIDLTPPETPEYAGEYVTDGTDRQVASGTPINDPTPSLWIGSNLGDKPSLYVDGVKVESEYDPETGALTPTEPLPEGEYQLTWTLTDAAGNESGESPAFELIVDTTAPATPATAISSYSDDVGLIRSAQSTAAVTDATRPGLQIEAGLTDTPSLYVNGNKVEATYDSETGVLTPNESLAEGSLSLTWTLTDVAGNESEPSPAIEVEIDVTAPADAPTSISSYADVVGRVQSGQNTATTTDDTRPVFKVDADLGPDPVLLVDGNIVLADYDKDAGTLRPREALAEGRHQINYAATDEAGNMTAAGRAFSLTILTTMPVAPTNAMAAYDDDAGPITRNASTAASTDDTRPAFIIGTTVPWGYTAILYANGTEIPSELSSDGSRLTPTEALAGGTYEFTVAIRNPAGNESAASPGMSLTIVTSPPATPSAPTTYLDSNLSQTELGSAEKTSDTTPGLYVGTHLGDAPKLYVDNEVVASTYNAETGILTPNSALALGARTLSYSLWNAHGESEKSGGLSLLLGAVPSRPSNISSYVDDVEGKTSTLESPTTGRLTNDARPAFIVSAGEDHDPVLMIDGRVVAAEYNRDAGTLTPTGNLADGNHTVQWMRVGEFGNSPASYSFSIEVDATGPSGLPAITQYITGPGSNWSSMLTPVNHDMSDRTPGFLLGIVRVDTYLNEGGARHLYINGSEITFSNSVLYENNAPKYSVLTPSNELSPGTYTVTWSLDDTAGNRGEQSPGTQFTIKSDASPKSLAFSDAIDLAELTEAAGGKGSSDQALSTLVSAFDATLSQQSWEAIAQSLEQHNGGV